VWRKADRAGWAVQGGGGGNTASDGGEKKENRHQGLSFRGGFWQKGAYNRLWDEGEGRREGFHKKRKKNQEKVVLRERAIMGV